MKITREIDMSTTHESENKVTVKVVMTERKRLTYQDLIDFRKRMEQICIPPLRHLCPYLEVGMNVKMVAFHFPIKIIFINYDTGVLRWMVFMGDYFKVEQMSLNLVIRHFELGDLWIY